VFTGVGKKDRNRRQPVSIRRGNVRVIGGRSMLGDIANPALLARERREQGETAARSARCAAFSSLLPQRPPGREDPVWRDLR
jgi:hypothetical protein